MNAAFLNQRPKTASRLLVAPIREVMHCLIERLLIAFGGFFLNGSFAPLFDAFQIAAGVRSPRSLRLLDLRERRRGIVVAPSVEELHGLLEQSLLARPRFDLPQVIVDLAAISGMF